MATGILIWWVFLCSVAVININIWIYAAILLARRKHLFDARIYRARRWSLALSAVFVLGCGFRSIFPVFDVQRICMIDSWFSTIAVGRSIAMVAELCLIAQFALLLYNEAKGVGAKFSQIVALLLVPIITVAELFSWFAVLTTNNVGHVVEESLWTFSAVLLVASLISLWPYISRSIRYVFFGGIGFGMAYIMFMSTVDVPMYYVRWQTELAQNKDYLSISQGIIDATRHCIVSGQWEVWRAEIPWMSLYFSVSVWLSILMTHFPRLSVESSQRT